VHQQNKVEYEDGGLMDQIDVELLTHLQLDGRIAKDLF
jgi:hypothetical protein